MNRRGFFGRLFGAAAAAATAPLVAKTVAEAPAQTVTPERLYSYPFQDGQLVQFLSTSAAYVPYETTVTVLPWGDVIERETESGARWTFTKGR